MALAVTLLGMKTPRIILFFAFAAIISATPSPACAQQPSGASQPKDAPQLVIIDTDIGDDIDDAFALALALRSPELHILGVTTTFGDTELRARLLDRYLAAVGRSDIPVAAGPATKNNNVFTQAAYARQAADRKHADGADFILKQIRQHPGEITLIGIGPLFTVQAAIERDPATFRKLKRVVIMGGSIYRGYGNDSAGKSKPPEPEWNIDRDPAGARALLAAGVPVFMMPLDSTQVHLEAKDREAIFSHGSPLTDQVTLLYHQWMAGSEWHSQTPTLFDPVAVAFSFRPELCPTKRMHIDVDEKGLTKPGEGAPNVHVCLESDEKGFLQLLQDRVAGLDCRQGCAVSGIEQVR
jgi:inosine-uridine nucleoside N-ribohydrolase